MMTDNVVLFSAKSAVTAGLSVIPVRLDGSKAPVGSWKEYQTRRPTTDEIEQWFHDESYGLAIVAGKVSGNLEILDVEGKAIDGGLWMEVIDLAKNLGMSELLMKILSGYCEYTPSGGLHILYRINGTVAGNLKLARDPSLAPDDDKKKDTVIETRGEGGYAIIAPTVDAVLGKWHIDIGSFATIPTLSRDEHEALHDLLKTFDKTVIEEPTITKPRIPTENLSPGDDFNQRTTWSTLLLTHDWQFVGKRGKIEYWRRPGKRIGVSATVGATQSGDRLVVHSTSTEFKTSPSSYDLFGAVTLLEYKGDFRAAAKGLAEQGFGAPARKAGEPVPTLSAGLGVDEFGDPIPAVGESLLDRMRARLYRGNAITEIPKAEPLVNGILNSGTTAVMYGLPKSGKSFLSLDIAAHIVAGMPWNGMTVDRKPVLYLLAEGSGGFSNRYMAWRKYHEIEDLSDLWLLTFPVRFLDKENVRAFIELVDEVKEANGMPGMIVIDTLARVMAGGNENDAADMSALIYSADVIRDHTEATTMLVHHSGKDETKGSRGHSSLLGALDTEFKISREDGTITFETTNQRDLESVDKLYFRLQKSEQSAVIVRINDGLIDDVSLVAIQQNLMIELSLFLEGIKEPIARTELTKHIKARDQTLTDALDALMRGGFIQRTIKPGKGKGYMFAHLKPFTAPKV